MATTNYTSPPNGVDNASETSMSQPTRTEQAKQKIGETGRRVGEYIDDASTTVGQKMERFADGLSDRSTSAVQSMNRAGRYLQDSTTSSMGRDITEVMRKNPTATLIAGLGLGWILGRALSR